MEQIMRDPGADCGGELRDFNGQGRARAPAGQLPAHDGHLAAVTRVPGLYVLGLRFLHRRNSSFVDGVGPDARFVAAHLTRRTPPAAP
jgi:hypothetical protein